MRVLIFGAALFGSVAMSAECQVGEETTKFVAAVNAIATCKATHLDDGDASVDGCVAAKACVDKVEDPGCAMGGEDFATLNDLDSKDCHPCKIEFDTFDEEFDACLDDNGFDSSDDDTLTEAVCACVDGLAFPTCDLPESFKLLIDDDFNNVTIQYELDLFKHSCTVMRGEDVDPCLEAITANMEATELACSTSWDSDFVPDKCECLLGIEVPDCTVGSFSYVDQVQADADRVCKQSDDEVITLTTKAVTVEEEEADDDTGSDGEEADDTGSDGEEADDTGSDGEEADDTGSDGEEANDDSSAAPVGIFGAMFGIVLASFL